jgi:hypothetical protein
MWGRPFVGELSPGRRMKHERDRLFRMSFTARRIAVVVALVPCGFFTSNVLFGWDWFGDLDYRLMVASFVVLFLVIRFLGPTIQQVRQHSDSKRKF